MKRFKKKKKKQQILPTNEEEYLRMLKESGIQPGDKVLVTRRAEDHEGFWHNIWALQMDEYIGEIHKVRSTYPYTGGITLERLSHHDRRYSFPVFVLKKVS